MVVVFFCNSLIVIAPPPCYSHITLTITWLELRLGCFRWYFHFFLHILFIKSLHRCQMAFPSFHFILIQFSFNEGFGITKEKPAPAERLVCLLEKKTSPKRKHDVFFSSFCCWTTCEVHIVYQIGWGFNRRRHRHIKAIKSDYNGSNR